MAQYKDSLFRTLLGRKKALLDIHNALHDSHYNEQTEITINTLNDTLWSSRKNDLSYLIDRKQIVLGEHQSSINRNMPFRFLYPVLRLFERQIPDKKTVYRPRLIKLPRPEFIVFYNGTAPHPERDTLRLSDAFERAAGFEEINLELTVKVYNINEGHNGWLLLRSEELKTYSFFVSQARRYEAEERKRGTPPEEAALKVVRQALADCMDAGLMKDFWENLTKEDIRMLRTEWEHDLEMEAMAEEALDTGLERGIGIGVQQDQVEMLALIDRGYTVEQLKNLLTSRLNSTQTVQS